MKDIFRSEPYDKWFRKLKDKQAKTKIYTRIERLAEGNPGDFRFLGDISELRIEYGPGYRVYYKDTGKKLFFCSVAAISPHRKPTLQKQG
jgi:putative addiction module killer protein